MATGTWMAYTLKFVSTVYPLRVGAWTISGYAAVWALLVNLAVTFAVSSALRALAIPNGDDATAPTDYVDR
jgi:SSS family solute:Na+ symporter